MIVSGRIEKPGQQPERRQPRTIAAAIKTVAIRMQATIQKVGQVTGLVGATSLLMHASTEAMPYVRPAGGLEAWSNLAYAAAGTVLLFQGNAFGLLMLMLAFVSWKYHATRLKKWQHADRAMVLSAVFALVALAYLSPPWMLVAVALGWAIERFMPNLEIPVILSVLAILWRLKAQAWMPLALIALAAALVWQAERYKLSTSPRGALIYDLLHSVWHILSAAALYLTAHLLL